MPNHELQENVLTPIACPKNVMTVLSLDGGGSKGILPISYLKNMKEVSGREVHQMFDLMGAISTGALIATALSLPDDKDKTKAAFSPKELEELYVNNVAHFFTNKTRHRIITLNGMLAPALNPNYKNDFFKASYKTASINDLLTKVVLFAYDIKSQKLRAICNLEACRSNLNNYFLSSLVSAVTNVIVAFPPMSFYARDSTLEYVISDPAALINNPSYFTYNEAKMACPKTKHIVVLSLGTGRYSDFQNIGTVTFWGLSQWLVPLLSASINTNSALINYSLRHKMLVEAKKSDYKTLPHLIYVRINPDIPLDLSSPFAASKTQLTRLKELAKKTYQKNSELLSCIAGLSKKDDINPRCHALFLEYIKNSQVQEQYRKLPDFMY